MRLGDYKPFTKGRMRCILAIYEEAYKFKRLPRSVRGDVHSQEWRQLIYAKKEEMDWGNAEALFFIELVRNYTRKQVRSYLLDNGSSIVRRGRKTRPRKKV